MDKPKYKRITPRSWKDNMSPSTGDDKNYPTINISLKDLPEAKDWKVGETYFVGFELKQVSMSQSKNGGNATFEIHGRHIEDEKDWEDEEDDTDDSEEDEDDYEDSEDEED